MLGSVGLTTSQCFAVTNMVRHNVTKIAVCLVLLELPLITLAFNYKREVI